jgi:DNA-directed RNA polymerase subunit F
MEGDGKVVPIAEVLKALEKESGKRELGYEQKLALAHAQQFSKLSLEDSGKLKDELMKVEHMTEALAYKIIEVLPATPEDVRVIFSKERYTLEQNAINSILEAVKKFA